MKLNVSPATTEHECFHSQTLRQCPAPRSIRYRYLMETRCFWGCFACAQPHAAVTGDTQAATVKGPWRPTAGYTRSSAHLPTLLRSRSGCRKICVHRSVWGLLHSILRNPGTGNWYTCWLLAASTVIYRCVYMSSSDSFRHRWILLWWTKMQTWSDLHPEITPPQTESHSWKQGSWYCLLMKYAFSP